MEQDTWVNREFWDGIAPHHAASEFYAVDRFLATRDTLGDIDKAEVGPVADLSVCHLQCHIGLDTLSLANRGANVTGLDFSAESLKIARELSARTGIAATFVHADVLEAADALDTNYDLVFTTGGVLMWIPDLARWADNCARLLRPGGVFYLHDIHPLAMALEPSKTSWRLAYSYFGSGHPIVTSADGSYAVSGVGLIHQETHEWIHPLGDVVTALVDAGLVIEFLHEHPNGNHDQASSGVSAATGARTPQLPASYSVRAHPAATGAVPPSRHRDTLT